MLYYNPHFSWMFKGRLFCVRSQRLLPEFGTYTRVGSSARDRCFLYFWPAEGDCPAGWWCATRVNGIELPD